MNADFEGGYADDPEGVAASVELAAATGIAGLSIEDSTRDGGEPLYPFDLAVERVRAARRAIDESGTRIVLTGRSEGFIVGRPDLDETIRRLQAYAEAGADCLYAPLVETPDQVSAIVAAVAPTPVNLLVHRPFITVSEAAELGVRRISVGAAPRPGGAGLVRRRRGGRSPTTERSRGSPSCRTTRLSTPPSTVRGAGAAGMNDPSIALRNILDL